MTRSWCSTLTGGWYAAMLASDHKLCTSLAPATGPCGWRAVQHPRPGSSTCSRSSTQKSRSSCWMSGASQPSWAPPTTLASTTDLDSGAPWASFSAYSATSWAPRKGNASSSRAPFLAAACPGLYEQWHWLPAVLAAAPLCPWRLRAGQQVLIGCSCGGGFPGRGRSSFLRLWCSAGCECLLRPCGQGTPARTRLASHASLMGV
mmetsp:Transcript_21222/g.49391  ORF Transcript_21222/g.49391 Transcript_21222/m.49391 type:complete len:204 (-) Transcript_21222:15-626(-)